MEERDDAPEDADGPTGVDGSRDPVVLVLGACAVVGRDSVAISPSLIQRRILARLAISRPGSVSVDELAEAIWGEQQPATSKTSIHNQISRIRQRLGADVIRTDGGRYRLELPTDIDDLADSLERVERGLRSGDAESARQLAEQTLRRWRGTPLEELDLPQAREVRRQLEETHRSLETMRLDAVIRSGPSARAVPEAERLVRAAPHDEHRWVLLIRALEAAGRRGDALGAFERARRVMVDELGLEPGVELRSAEEAVLLSGVDRAQPGPTALVGRDDLLDRALVELDAASTIVLTGESGVGKTRVLDELGRRLRRRGRLVARSSCPWHPDAAISTLLELAQELDVRLDPALPPVAAFCAALDLRASTGRPIVLCVDDIDRCGPTSLAALHAASDLEHVALVATATDTQLLGSDLRSSILVVPELDLDAFADLVAARLDVASGHAGLLAWLHEMSGGNPTLADHLIDEHLRDHGRTEDDRANGGHAPSPELRELVRRQLDRVGAATRTALEVASVCGPVFPTALLEELAPPQGVAGAVAAALLEERVDETGQHLISFRHGAVQRILYDDLSPGRRMEIHHQAGAVLERLGAPVPNIASHAIESAEFDPRSAAGWAIDAARAATALGAHAEAATWCEAAVEAASGATGAERVRVVALIGRGDALRLAGSVEQEPALFDAADAAFALGEAALIGDAAFAVLQLGATTESGSLHTHAVEIADRALAAVTDTDQRSVVAAAASLTHSMTGASERCRDLFVHAAHTAASPATRRHVLPFAYLAIGHPADLDLRTRLTEELLSLGDEVDDPVARFEGHQLAFSVGLQRCDGTSVRNSLRALDSLVVRVGDIGRRWALLYQRAAVAHLDGELDEAERLAEDALTLFSPVSPSRAFAAYGAQVLPIRIAQGRLDELADTIEDLVRDQPGVPAWHAALALVLAQAEPDRSTRHASAALDGVPEDFTWLAAHVIGGRAAATVGDADTCTRYLERLLPWSGLGCWQGTCSYGPVDSVIALLHHALGDTDRSVRFATQALEQVGLLQAPVFEGELRAMLDR